MDTRDALLDSVIKAVAFIRPNLLLLKVATGSIYKRIEVGGDVFQNLKWN